MSVDLAFKNAGKKPGLEIWRIEKLKVVAITDQDKFGKFHTGDSYICLYTEKTSGGYRWDIHFWLGKETTQDEAGVAAYKTVELDDSLGGAPVQYREVQEHESQQFQKLFTKYGGLRYLEGGVESGFKKVDRDAYEKRLFHVKGKRNIRVNQVKISHESLNSGDCFILDCGLKLYQFNGKEASKTEKIKAAEFTNKIRNDERGGRATIKVIDQDRDDDSEFFSELGGKGPIAAATSDEEYEKKKNAATKLYRVSDASGSVKVEEVGSAPLKKDMLDSSDAFILDTSQSIFVWIGKKATKQEKDNAWKLAQGFITEKGYPNWTPISRLVEGGETPIFISQFANWPNPQSSPNFTSRRSNIAKVEQKKVDVGAMHKKGEREAQAMVDDGSGKLEIWRVENFEKVPVDKKMYGQLYQGDSYVMLYTYEDKQGREAYIIYFWQGNDSTQDEKGASAALATALDDEYGGAPVQVRVVQNKEPDHFLALFKGKFIIHQGGKGSGFKNSEQGDEYDEDGTSLFHVRGTTPLNTKAVQVAEVAASLNSNDCFVLLKPKNVYVWYGKYSTGDEREVAKSVADHLAHGRSVEAYAEGSEHDDFWTAIGGKGEYTTAQAPSIPDFEPRLFQCSNASGRFDVEEIFDFVQEDLVEDDVMLLDTGNEVFLWVGQGARPEEKKAALETAIEYIKNSPGDRSPDDTPILTVKQGFEPPMFTQHFVWDAEKAKASIQDYDALKAQLEAGGGIVTSAADELKKFSATYSYEVLLKRPLPDGVDATKLENHLNPDEFEKVMGMSREKFDALPGWKKTNVKKEKKIF